MDSNTNILQVIALVVGIASIPLACVYATAGIAAGIAGLILSIVVRRNTGGGMSLAALICSIVGLCIGIVSIILMAAFLYFALG